tara:strand:- start:338 stop:472 length:135 start_codon:yes stop_codon:yes gene_type:complete
MIFPFDVFMQLPNGQYDNYYQQSLSELLCIFHPIADFLLINELI